MKALGVHVLMALFVICFLFLCVFRKLNQKIMELESDVDDLKNQQTASKVEGGSAMDKKYREHL